jgi:hypothetical protein
MVSLSDNKGNVVGTYRMLDGHGRMLAGLAIVSSFCGLAKRTAVGRWTKSIVVYAKLFKACVLACSWRDLSGKYGTAAKWCAIQVTC